MLVTGTKLIMKNNRILIMYLLIHTMNKLEQIHSCNKSNACTWHTTHELGFITA